MMIRSILVSGLLTAAAAHCSPTPAEVSVRACRLDAALVQVSAAVRTNGHDVALTAGEAPPLIAQPDTVAVLQATEPGRRIRVGVRIDGGDISYRTVKIRPEC